MVAASDSGPMPRRLGGWGAVMPLLVSQRAPGHRLSPNSLSLIHLWSILDSQGGVKNNVLNTHVYLLAT